MGNQEDMASRNQPCADAQERSPIPLGYLLAVAKTFTELRDAIEEILRDHIAIDDDGYTINGHDAAAEALIFFFDEKMNPSPALEASTLQSKGG